MNVQRISISLNVVFLVVIAWGYVEFRKYQERHYSLEYADTDPQKDQKNDEQTLQQDYATLVDFKSYRVIPKIFLGGLQNKATLDPYLIASDGLLKAQNFDQSLKSILKFDSDWDGVLSKQELEHLGVSGRDVVEKGLETWKDFRAIDINKDRKLSANEVMFVATKSFATVDLDRNKVISKDEYDLFFRGMSGRDDGPKLNSLIEGCSFSSVSFPKETQVYAVSAYEGKPTGYQIEDAGEEATQVDVVVNVKDVPIVLILASQDSSIVWNVKRTKGTEIMAIVAGGYYNQVITGIEEQVPRIVATFTDKNNSCGYFYGQRGRDSEMLNSVSTELFDRPITEIIEAKNGFTIVGKHDFQASDIIHVENKPIKTFATLDQQLEEAERSGLIRRATLSDVKAWSDGLGIKETPETAYKNSLHPFGASEETVDLVTDVDLKKAYVILKDFKLPNGLYGGYSITLMLPVGVNFPKGDMGHSTIYDFNTMKCKGGHPVCRHADMAGQ